MPHRFDIPHRHRAFTVIVTDDGALELWLDGCLRKRCRANGGLTRYVWTNIELDWEEHHYVEARFLPANGALSVTINGESVLEKRLPGR